MKQKITAKELAQYALAILRKKTEAQKAGQGYKYFKEKVFILGISAADLR